MDEFIWVVKTLENLYLYLYDQMISTFLYAICKQFYIFTTNLILMFNIILLDIFVEVMVRFSFNY